MFPTRLVAIGAALFGLGCAYASPIQPAKTSDSPFRFLGWGDPVRVVSDVPDGEQFRVAHRASSGFTPVSAVRRSARSRANEFCSNKGSVVTAITEQSSSSPHILGNFPRYELVFVCTVPPLEPLGGDPYDRLERLKELLDSGVITQDEFEREKGKILSR